MSVDVHFTNEEILDALKPLIAKRLNVYATKHCYDVIGSRWIVREGKIAAILTLERRAEREVS